MAILLNSTTRQRVYLRKEHIFGRGHAANTLLSDRSTSLLHASIRWTGSLWELRDHSRNGTRVNKAPIPPNQPFPLKVGAVIDFARDGKTAWVVEDLSSPASVLWPLVEDAPLINLSDGQELFVNSAGAIRFRLGRNGEWIAERARHTIVLRDGDEIKSGNARWCFLSGQPANATLAWQPGFRVADAILHFDVSLDEEHVSLAIVMPERTIELGERTHHYCLLMLARQRMKDARGNIDPQAQGWLYVADLARMLGMELPHVNIQIFRARQQIADKLGEPSAAPPVVERRRGEIRFGDWPARIVRGSALEGIFDPFLFREA